MPKDPQTYDLRRCPVCNGSGIDPIYEEEERVALEWCKENKEPYTKNDLVECISCEGTGKMDIDDIRDYYEQFN